MLPANIHHITRTLSLAAALLASACSSTSLVSSWRPPTARPLHLKGAKVAAVVLVSNPGSRRTAEDTLASEITSRGALGVPLHRLLPNATGKDEAEVRAALEKANIKGVVVMRPIGATQQVTAQPAYDHYWGGYYGYGWSNAYEYRANTIVSVDIRVYSLEQNQLVWAGESQTTNPERVDEFVIELADVTAAELQGKGLIGSP
jgi:hypothetical protein